VNPAILSLNFYDFHLEAFLPLFLGMFYYSYLTRRWRWYAVFFLLSIFTIDFASVLVGSIALAHLVRQLSVRRTANGSRLSLRIRLDLDRPRALLLFATIHGFGRIRNPGNARAVLACAIVVSAFLTPLNPLMQGALPGIAYEQGLPIPNAHDAILHEVIALIPPHASVLTQNNLFPQVSGRSDVYLYRPSGNETIDYVLADTRTTDYFLRVWSQTPL